MLMVDFWESVQHSVLGILHKTLDFISISNLPVLSKSKSNYPALPQNAVLQLMGFTLNVFLLAGV